MYQWESKSTAMKLKYTIICKNLLNFRDVKMWKNVHLRIDVTGNTYFHPIVARVDYTYKELGKVHDT